MKAWFPAVRRIALAAGKKKRPVGGQPGVMRINWCAIDVPEGGDLPARAMAETAVATEWDMGSADRIAKWPMGTFP